MLEHNKGITENISNPDVQEFQGEGWRVAKINIPEQKENTNEYLENIKKTFNNQFGSKKVGFDKSVLAPRENGLAQVNYENGKLYPVLQDEGIKKDRTVQLRLLAHEIQHCYNQDDWGIQNKLSQLKDFNNLQERFKKKFVEIKDKLKKDEKHYLSPEEILARLRAYQIFLQQGKPWQTAEPHEFFEILDVNDLRWLDEDYLRRIPLDLPEQEKRKININK